MNLTHKKSKKLQHKNNYKTQQPTQKQLNPTSTQSTIHLMRRNQPQPKQTWITDPNNKKYQQLKNNFFTSLQQQAKQGKIGYYDFLLVAKRLCFRFEESSHLMALKNFFSKNKNLITCKRLTDALSVSQSSLIPGNEEKVIVKFNVPDIHFAPIKEETLEDEEFDEERSMRDLEQGDYEEGPFQKLGNQVDEENERELMEKMAIILSIKVEEMQKKLIVLTHAPTNSLLTYFDQFEEEEINYNHFKKGIIEVISNHNQKVKLSEDDVKTIFHLLDEEKEGFITTKQIQKLKNLEESGLGEKMKEFYKSRINKEMVKNTLFKLGKVKNNSIQIYQLKNASLMEFKQIEEAIVNHNDDLQKTKFNVRVHKDPKQKSRIPHFGPLKGAAKWKNKQRQTQSQPHYNQLYASTHPVNPIGNLFSINKERQKIDKILKQYKDPHKVINRSQKNGETVASKLRSLFIHKVILPREKMLEEQKERFLKSKIPQHQLSIKPLK